MRALADAIGEPGDTRDLVERSQGLLSWIDVDAELAALLDTSADELAGTRGSGSSTVLEFTIADRSCVIEVTTSDDELRGHVLGARSDEIFVRAPDGTAQSSPVDDQGFFTFSNPPHGTIRLECALVDDRRVHSDWFVF